VLAHLPLEGDLSPLPSGEEPIFKKPRYLGGLTGASTWIEKDKTAATGEAGTCLHLSLSPCVEQDILVSQWFC